MKIVGVYKITNNITGDFYVGSSNDVKRRWATHKCPSMWKKYPNIKLYKAMAKYGLGNFIFEVLEETADLHNREQYWIEQLKPTYNDRYAKGYNIERCKETTRRCCKEWHKANKEYYEIHRDKELAKSKAYRQAHRDECLARSKDWHKANRDKQLAKYKAYKNRLCLYEGETLTLGALSARFTRQGIPHATIEAKKYLL